MLIFPFAENAALSATTVNTIEGTKPILSNNNGLTEFDLGTVLEITMPNKTTKYDNTHTDPIIMNTTDSFDKYTTFVTANGEPFSFPSTYYYDADGDLPADTMPVNGQVTATWYNGTTKITNLAQQPSVCEGPYTLEIKTSNIVVKSKYGNPIDNNYGTVSKTYNFMIDNYAICYLKPAQMTVYSNLTLTDSAFPYQSASNPGGYNEMKWEYDSATNKHKGFKASSDFPTTGFAQAKFQMVMSGGDQSLFSFSSSDTSKATINSSGNVTLLEKPTSPITLTAKLKSDTSKQYSHTFTLSKWALPQSTTYQYGNTDRLSTSDSFPALDLCRTVGPNVASGTTTWEQAVGTDPTWRKQYLYTREELTNSPLKVLPMNETITRSDKFSRDTGTFMGEWGYVYNGYGSSGWSSSGWYWTSDAWSTSIQFVILTDGVVANNAPNNRGGTVCRG